MRAKASLQHQAHRIVITRFGLFKFDRLADAIDDTTLTDTTYTYSTQKDAQFVAEQNRTEHQLLEKYHTMPTASDYSYP